MQSKGEPVIYNERVIQLFDRLKVTEGQQFKVTFESVNSDWRQGVRLTTDRGFEVNNQSVKQSIVLWHDTAPREVTLTIHTQKGECLVANVWDTGDGAMHSGHNGAAMIVEELNAGKRYRCNDGRADDDFDDLVFCIEPYELPQTIKPG
jgi:hypothetical protein